MYITNLYCVPTGVRQVLKAFLQGCEHDGLKMNSREKVLAGDAY